MKKLDILVAVLFVIAVIVLMVIGRHIEEYILGGIAIVIALISIILIAKQRKKKTDE